MNITIEIGKKGDRKLGPKDNPAHTKGNRTQVRKGDVVTFTIPGADNEPRPTITFKGASPFSEEVTYGKALKVEGAPSPTIFRYDCSARIKGENLSTDSGGEMEVLPGP